MYGADSPGGALRIELFGGCRISAGGRPVEDGAWRLRKARTLIKLLALAPGHRLHRDQVAAALWPSLDPQAAANNLKQVLHVARRVLDGVVGNTPPTPLPSASPASPASPAGPGPPLTPSGGAAGGGGRGVAYLPLQGDLLCLYPDGPLWVDVDAFEAAAGAAAGSDDPVRYRAAIALYTGELLPEDRYEDWAAERRERLRGVYVGLLLQLARLHQARGEHLLAIDVLGRALDAEPAHEEAHAGLMRAYALSGQPHLARRQFERLREALRRDLDAEPGPASRRLYAEIVGGGFPPPPKPGPAVGVSDATVDLPLVTPTSLGGPAPLTPDPTPISSPFGNAMPSLPLAGPATAAGPGAPAASGPGGRAARQAPPLPSPLTSFVGRERELAAVQRTLAGTRLLTLTGSGGSGKTRLALQAAGEVQAASRAPGGAPDGAPEGAPYPDGVWLVDLSPVDADARVPQAIAGALGVGEERDRPVLEALGAGEERDRPVLQTLAEAIRHQRLLLLLDNCERVVDGVATAVETLLRAAPGLTVLATSRQALGVSGETVWRVPSLDLPPPGSEVPPEQGRPDAPGALRAPEGLAAYDAVRLFLERARASRRDFALTGENASALVSLCRHLDGLPLALELAAARTRVLSVEQIAARLDDRFRLLTGGSRTAPPRQQTLLATVAWSYDLLPPAERRLFARLAVFAGGWTLEAAEAVCAGEGLDPDDVLDLLSQLVDKSLVLVDEADGGGEVRYRLLESLREFAAERLAEEGEGAGSAVRRRHAAHYAALAEQAAGGLYGAAQAHWLARLETEHDNLRQALRWAVETGQTELGLRLGVSLWRFWNAHAYLSEGREWLGHVLDLPGGEASPALAGLRGRALTAAGSLAWAQGDYGAARALHQAALQALQALGDQRGAAMALFGLGQVARLTGDEREAHGFYQRSLAIFQGLRDRWGESVVLRDLGHVAGDEGDHQEARRYYARSLALAQELGDRSGAASAMMYLGLQAYHQEHYDVARSSYEAALAIWRELGNRRSTAESLRLLGLVAGALGDGHQATALHTESLALRREAGDRYGVAESLLSLADPARERGELDRAGALLRESLTLCRELGSKRMMAVCLLKLAAVLAAAGEPVRAARLLGAGETELATLGAGTWPADRAAAEATAGALAGALGQEALERARGEGQAMALQEAVAYALAP